MQSPLVQMRLGGSDEPDPMEPRERCNNGEPPGSKRLDPRGEHAGRSTLPPATSRSRGARVPRRRTAFASSGTASWWSRKTSWNRHDSPSGTIFVLHYYRGMKNVTITLDEEVARWARVLAAQQNTSVSRLLGDVLRQMKANEEGYEAAMQAYLSGAPTQINNGTSGYPRREELHDRSILR